MKLNNEQKKLIKNYFIYAAGYMVVYPIVKSLLDKEFTWETILVCLITVLVVGVISFLLVLGAKNPND